MTVTINRCSVCQKQVGTSYCTGCGIYFCTKDFKIHRGILSGEMNTLMVHRNDLQGKINKTTQPGDLHSPLFAQIDKWEDMMTEKVRVVAEHTRRQVAELLNSKRVRLGNDFQRFSEELTDLRQTENFVEHDLTRLKYMIHQFNQEMKQLNKPLTIVLHTELSDRLVWSRLIYAEEKSTYAGLQHRQQQVKEDQQSAIVSPRKQPPDDYSFSMRLPIKLLAQGRFYRITRYMNTMFVLNIHFLCQHLSKDQHKAFTSW